MSPATTDLTHNEIAHCICQSGDQAGQGSNRVSSVWKSRRSIKMLAMYTTMVVVSTTAIYFLEHSTLANAFRTALVAAIGKTVAANWVSGIFE